MPFRAAHDKACNSNDVLSLTVRLRNGFTSADDLHRCLIQSYANASQLFSSQGSWCTEKDVVLRNITCASFEQSSSSSSSSSSCSASCYLWFENSGRGSSTLILFQNIAPDKIKSLETGFAKLTCASESPLSMDNCCGEPCEFTCTAYLPASNDNYHLCTELIVGQVRTHTHHRCMQTTGGPPFCLIVLIHGYYGDVLCHTGLLHVHICKCTCRSDPSLCHTTMVHWYH